MFRFVFALLALLFAAPAMAANAPLMPHLGPTEAVAEGLCRAIIEYQDGRRITMNYTLPDRLIFDLVIPGGRFQKNRRYDLGLALDGTSRRKVRALALNEDSLRLDMGANRPFINKLGGAFALEIGSGAKTVSFILPSMEPLLESLERCSHGHPAPIEDLTDPSRPRPPLMRKRNVPPPQQQAEPAPVTEQEPAPTEEAFSDPTGLRAYLERAGFKKFAFLPLDNIPKEARAADYVWEMGNILGGLRSIEAPAGISLEEMIGLHLKGLKEKCAGTFTATVKKEKTVKTAILREADAVCKPKEEQDSPTVIVALAFTITANSTISVFTYEGPEEYKDEALTAREKTARLIAQEGPPQGTFIEN